MGASNVKAAELAWSHLPAVPAKLLAHMARLSLDHPNGSTPARRYFAGRDEQIKALGYAEPSRAAYKCLDRAMAQLKAAGAVVMIERPRYGHHAVYDLKLHPGPAGVAPRSGDELHPGPADELHPGERGPLHPGERGPGDKEPLQEPPSTSPPEAEDMTEAVQLPMLATLDGGKLPATRHQTPNQRANTLARIYSDAEPLSHFMATRGIVARAVKAGYSDEQIRAALLQIVAEGRPLTVGTLRYRLNPPKARSTTDERMAKAIEAGRRVGKRLGTS